MSWVPNALSSRSVSVDPTDTFLMTIRKNILDNRLILRKDSIILEELDLATRQLISAAKDDNWRMVLIGNQAVTVADVVKNMLDSGSSWNHIAGNILQSAGVALWSIPEFNVLWGTAAYASGSLLTWLDLDNSHKAKEDHMMHARMNIAESVHEHFNYENIMIKLRNAEDEASQAEMLLEWSHDAEHEMWESEQRTAAIENAFRGIFFWADSSFPQFIGITLGVGSPCVTLTVRCVDVAKRASRANTMSFNHHDYSYVENWIRTAAKDYIGTNNVKLVSYSNLFLKDKITAERFHDLSRLVGSISGTVAERKAQLFKHLCD